MTEMLRFNEGKPRLSLFPATSYQLLLDGAKGDFLPMVEAVTRILEYGSNKYEVHNWKKSGSWLKCADSALRHYWAGHQVEVNDEESGLPHLAHYACNLCFLYEFVTYETGTDDRWREYGAPKFRPMFADDVELSVINFMMWLDGGPKDYLELAIIHIAAWFSKEDNEDAMQYFTGEAIPHV